MSNDMESMRTFANQLWKYMVPKINAKLSSNVSYFRAEVVSNPGNNKLEVQRPMENGTLTLPCTTAMSNAQPHQQVVALVMGNMSNAIIVGDGKLNVPGGGGDAGIANFQAQPDGSLVIALTNGNTLTATPVINAFSNVQVGSTTISADNNADTLTLVGDGLATLTGDATNDSVTIYVDPNHTHITTQVLDLVNANSYGPSDLVTFDADVAEVPLKNCIVDIEPAQAGSGEPSPTNVRPISGWTGANVTKCGKNVLELNSETTTRNGVTFTVDKVAGTVTVSGTPTQNTSFQISTLLHTAVGKSYILSGSPSGGSLSSYYISLTPAINGKYVYDAADGGLFTPTEPMLRANIVVRGGTTYSNLVFRPMIRLASDSDASFEPYESRTVSVDWTSEAGTVYGGTLDVLTGELTVDSVGVDMGTLTWGLWNAATNIFYVSLSNMKLPVTLADRLTEIMCSCYAPDTQVNVSESMGNERMMRYPSGRIFIRDTSYSNATAFKTAVSGQTLVYPLAAPITYQLSPQIISTLLGNNNIWADCGTISVDYGAFLSALDKAIEEHSDDDIRHITEAERETWDSKADSPHTHDASDITSGIFPAERGGTGNGNGYIQMGQMAGTTLGTKATAEGTDNTASGAYVHAEGFSTTASGYGSHSEGSRTTASGSESHAEGAYTVASNTGCHAEGYHTTASGLYAHSEGSETVASGQNSHVEGLYTIASGRQQHVFGQYNIADTTSVEIVGWGHENTRKNIRTLSDTGNEWIAGTLTQASDARLKDVQGEIPDLSSIRAVRFRWKNGDDKEHLGYLAQDVEGIAPYLVGIDSNGYKSLDYIALLTAKVEMLEQEIEKLKQ